MNQTNQSQVVVVGAGPAGLLAALRLAEKGISCRLLEGRPRRRFGRQHCIELDSGTVLNGVLPQPPQKSLLYAGDIPADILSPTGRYRFNVTPLPAYGVKLWEYQEALLAEVERLGVAVHFDTRVEDVRRGEDHRAILELTSRRGAERLECELVVLATGVDFHLDRSLYAHFHLRRKVLNRDLLVAWQERRRLKREAIDSRRLPAPMGSVGYRVGCAGPISTLGLWTSAAGDEAALLGGSIVADGHLPPAEMVGELRRELGIFGRRLSGAGAPIPIRRPVDSLVGGPVALIGDAGCQVYPMTGCGVGLAGHAAQMLAEAAVDYLGGGRHSEDLWQYNVSYQRRFGSRQASSEAFTTGLRHAGRDGALVEKLFAVGLAGAEDYLRSLELGPAFPSFAGSLQRARASLTLARDDARFLAGVVGRAVAIHEAYRRFYPAMPDWDRVRQFVSYCEKILKY